MATKKVKEKKPSAPAENEVSADASRDLFEAYVANTTQNADQVVQKESSGKGLKLYEEIEQKDGHIASVIQSRKIAVVGREWEVVPASGSPEDKKRAEFVEQNLKEINLEYALYSQLDALMKGFAVSEIMWEARNGQVWLKGLRHRKPWRFVFDKDYRLRMTTEKDPIGGEEVDESKFWVLTFQPRYGNRYGNALGQKLYWPYLFKKSNLRFWSVFNEKFGSPTPIGKYNPGTKKEQQEKLLSALTAIQQDTGIVVPKDMEVDLLEGQRRGSFETYSGFLSWCDATQSKVVLGQTLTTEAGKVGSLALGKVHEQVRAELIKADADLLSQSLNETIVRRLIDFNFANTIEYPKFWIGVEEKDFVKKDLAERDALIAKMGKALDNEYVEETYEVRLERGKLTRALEEEREKGDSEEFAEPGEADPEDTVGHFVERALDEIEQDAMVDTIRRNLFKAKSLEEFQDGLIELYGKLPTDAMAATIQKAMEASDLAGRFDAEEEK